MELLASGLLPDSDAFKASGDAVKLTIDNLQRIYVIVIALSIGEAFKQFVAELPKTGSGDLDAPKTHWERLPALVAFMALVVPFCHGMNRHFVVAYLSTKHLTPNYGVYLLIDCAVFTIEAGMFFFLSRRLAPELWHHFYACICILMFVDAAWGAFSWYSGQLLASYWIILDIVFGLVLAMLVWLRASAEHDWIGRTGSLKLSVVGAFLMIARTFIDYLGGWEFYFPAVM